jgi:hypothetical protein
VDETRVWPEATRVAALDRARYDGDVARIFLLSPASCSGERAQMLMRERAAFPLARELRSARGAALGEVFSFLSGLYFRGKLAYGRAFACPPRGAPGVAVITATSGLVEPDARVTLSTMRAFAESDIHERAPRYRSALERSAAALARLAPEAEIVLLGSIATGKYVDVLDAVFAERLRFPAAFVGRGDMSRGGLLLRCVRAGEELDYIAVAGAERHGPRPPRLTPLPRRASEP